MTASRVAKQVSYKLADDAVAFRVRCIEALFGAGTIPAALEALAVRELQPNPSRPIAAASLRRSAEFDVKWGCGLVSSRSDLRRVFEEDSICVSSSPENRSTWKSRS